MVWHPGFYDLFMTTRRADIKTQGASPPADVRFSKGGRQTFIQIRQEAQITTAISERSGLGGDGKATGWEEGARNVSCKAKTGILNASAGCSDT